MLDVGTFSRSTLTGSTALTALVPASAILATRPEIVPHVPKAIYFSDDQSDCEFVDNHPIGTNANVTIDVYVRGDTPYAICKIICDLMDSLLWVCTTNVDAPDPDTAVRHRHLVFSRPLLAGNI